MGWRGAFLGLAVGCLGLAPMATHAQTMQRVELSLPDMKGNDTNVHAFGWLVVALKQPPANGSFQVDTALYPALDSLKTGRKWSEVVVLRVTTPATTTDYTLRTVQLSDIGIDAPDALLTFSYGQIAVSSAKTPPGMF
jgi:hypothetical protein